MPRYQWHVISNQNKIAIYVLGGLVHTTDDSRGWVQGDIATNYNTYFRLGGKCSKACKEFYATHKERHNVKEFKPELGHYSNGGERKPRIKKGLDNV